MFLEVATNLLGAGVCCTVPVLLLFLAMKVCRDVFHIPFNSGTKIAYGLFGLAVMGVLPLIQYLASEGIGTSLAVRIPVLYYPESTFSALRPTGRNWFAALLGIAGVGTVIVAIIFTVLAKRKHLQENEASVLLGLNWYNPVYWLFFCCCAKEKTRENGAEEVPAGDESGFQADRISRAVFLAVIGVAIAVSILFMPTFELRFPEQEEILSLLGAPRKGIIKSDFVSVSEKESFGTPYFSADDRYSTVEGIDFLRWNYAKEVDEADVYAWMQPLEESLTQAFGEPKESPPEKGIFGNPAEKVLEWTTLDDNGEIRTIKMLYVPHDVYYSDEIQGGMAVEVRLDR